MLKQTLLLNRNARMVYNQLCATLRSRPVAALVTIAIYGDEKSSDAARERLIFRSEKGADIVKNWAWPE